LIGFSFSFVILDVDSGVTLPRGFVYLVTSTDTSFSEVMFTNFAEFDKLHILGIILHLFDYFRYRIHEVIVSLLIPFVNRLK
jgi:hypothetical protein